MDHQLKTLLREANTDNMASANAASFALRSSIAIDIEHYDNLETELTRDLNSFRQSVFKNLGKILRKEFSAYLEAGLRQFCITESNLNKEVYLDGTLMIGDEVYVVCKYRALRKYRDYDGEDCYGPHLTSSKNSEEETVIKAQKLLIFLCKHKLFDWIKKVSDVHAGKLILLNHGIYLYGVGANEGRYFKTLNWEDF